MIDKKILVKRFPENPLIIPDDIPWLKSYPKCWRGVFNVGVIYDERDNLFKMLFRGGARIFAQLGYAESISGRKDWHIFKDPVLKRGFGVEDPRIVRWLDGYYYIFATVCSLWYHISGGKGGKLGIWKTKDFRHFKWVGTPFKGENKNAAIFPELIDYSAYLIYRKFPSIWICQTRDFTLRSDWDNHRILLSSKVALFSATDGSPTKIGLAGPPIKTNKGWLVIFHAKYGTGMGKKMHYCLGFLVLDLKDPAKIVYIHHEPILLPEKPEEIIGCTPNVVFSCATIDKDDRVYIYWGGADRVVCGGYLEKSDLWMCY